MFPYSSVIFNSLMLIEDLQRIIWGGKKYFTPNDRKLKEKSSGRNFIPFKNGDHNVLG